MQNNKFGTVHPWIAMMLVSLFAGCATKKPDLAPYVYSSPIIVSFTSLLHTNNYFVAIFTFKNVSSNSMSYGGYDRQRPVFEFQLKNREPISNDLDEIVPSFMLAPGQVGTFQVKRDNFSIPFRGGISMAGEFGSKSETYWSPYFNPSDVATNAGNPNGSWQLYINDSTNKAQQ